GCVTVAHHHEMKGAVALLKVAETEWILPRARSFDAVGKAHIAGVVSFEYRIDSGRLLFTYVPAAFL
ncbi:hypothetical protein PFISCL1PPCAC_22217, partial [Pristionchus fissidentatus]